LVKVKHTRKRYSLYSSDDLRAKIEQPRRWQYNPGDFLAIELLKWHQNIEDDDDNGNWTDPEGPSNGRSLPGDGLGNDDSEGEEGTEGGEIGTGKGK
jgi:hypothetical protein